MKQDFNTRSGRFEQAARAQAEALYANNPALIRALEAVNRMQGVEWYLIHPKTWDYMMNGQYFEAADEIARSGWYRRAPEEVKPFQAALRDYAEELIAKEPPAHSATFNAAVSAPESAAQTYERFLTHLMNREGWRNDAYRDSLGKLTVGVGHLVLPQDRLREGDRISNEQVRGFLEKDAQKAFNAARLQCQQLGVDVYAKPDFLIALGSVNFQLGTGWRNIFPKTWQDMMNGNFENAANRLEQTRWNEQTPVRVDDFQSALRQLDQSRHPGLTEAALDKILQPSTGIPVSAFS